MEKRNSKKEKKNKSTKKQKTYKHDLTAFPSAS